LYSIDSLTNITKSRQHNHSN